MNGGYMGGGEGTCLAGAVKQVDTDPCSNTNPRRISLAFYTRAVGQPGPLFSWRGAEGRLGRCNLTNCSMCVLCFPSKERSLTTATGRAAAGSLHVRTSSHATTGNTRATGRFSVRNVTGPSQGQTTSLYIWKDTYETWRCMKAPKKDTNMLETTPDFTNLRKTKT